MANCCKIRVHGWAPYDIARRIMDGDSNHAKHFIAELSAPVFGFRIHWTGEEKKIPVPETGGQYSYHKFIITGVEAMWMHNLVEVFRGWKAAGAEFEKALFDDIEAGEVGEYDALADINKAA